MSNRPPSSPLRYRSSFETPKDDEAETTAAIVDTMRRIMETTSEDYGRAVRSVHAKSHGLLHGEMHVSDGLPVDLAQGLFAKPGTYPVALRLSTNPGDILDDSVSTPRGLAVKVVGVEGERLPGSEGQATQDFVLANAPAFQASDAESFLKNLKLLQKTTDTSQAWKKAFSATLRGVEAAVERSGGESFAVKGLGGEPATHILGETFYSQAPLLYGPYIAKLAIVPIAPALTELTGAPLDIKGKPDALRDAVTEFFREKEGEWEIRVQLCTDLDSMPIEDASVVWPEESSPYVAVARVTVPPQQAWSETRVAEMDEALSFSPWHGLAAHRPLGSIMRARKAAYEASAEFRASRNKRPVVEPRTGDDLPKD